MGVGAALPIVDLASFASAEDLGAELMRVGRNPGFFYVVGHDLSDDVASHVFRLAQHFFDAPAEEKLAYGNGSGDLVSLPLHGTIILSLGTSLLRLGGGFVLVSLELNATVFS